jgi:spore germination cell wall hydrolase CwlJ-like protein
MDKRQQAHRGAIPRALFAAVATCASGFSGPAASQTSSGEVSDDQRCLALSMYFEARSEGPEGMRAVGSVVLNRIASDEFPDTACAVVYEGGETPPCQFSWWCDGRSDAPTNSEHWETALALAAEMLEERGDDPTDGALFFHSADIPVPWQLERKRTVQILGHVYYR